MKASELRIGNWIKAEGGLIEVKYITPYIEFQAIELSADLLQSVGFNEVNHIAGYRFFHHPKYKVYIYKNHSEWMGHGIKHLEYFHQLQNLIFALTGEELKIKP